MAFNATSVPTTIPALDGSPQAAISAAQAFLWAVLDASVTQDLVTLNAMTTGSCTCRDLMTNVIKTQKEQQIRIKASALAPMSGSLLSLGADTAEVRVRYRTPAYVTVPRVGKSVRTALGPVISVDVSLRVESGSWKVSQFVTAK